MRSSERRAPAQDGVVRADGAEVFVTNEVGRRQAGERAKVGDEVRLVVIAVLGGEHSPVGPPLVQQSLHHRAKPRDSTEALGAEADRLLEAAAQVTAAVPDAALELLETERAAVSQHDRRCLTAEWIPRL